MKTAGFNLKQWETNYEELYDILINDNGKDFVCESNLINVLGLNRDISNNELSFNACNIAAEPADTKKKLFLSRLDLPTHAMLLRC